jgi:radical SAM protein with 4Fe4S-binding SPASM domain
MTEDDIKFLSDLNPDCVGVSIDGTKSVHEAIRGIGNYDKSFNNIDLMKKYDIEVTAITTVSKKNMDNLYGILAANLFHKIDSWQIQVASPMGRMERGYSLDNKEYNILCKTVNEMRNNYSSLLNIQGADCMGIGNKQMVTDYKWQGCQAGLCAIGIRSNGDIVPCLSIQDDKYLGGNIRNESLESIWNNPDNFLFNRLPRVFEGKCAECNDNNECKAGCSSINSSNGNINESPYCLKK